MLFRFVHAKQINLAYTYNKITTKEEGKQFITVSIAVPQLRRNANMREQNARI